MVMLSSLRVAWVLHLVMNRASHIRVERGRSVWSVKPQHRPFGRRWWGAVASLTT